MTGFERDFFTAKTLPACRATCFLAGAGMGAWAPLVPFARERAGIGEGQLGLLLLCLGTGSMLMMPFVGRLASRIGCRRTMMLASAGIALSLLGLASVTDWWALMLFLLMFGASVGTADVNMSLQGSLAERRYGRQMMSGFHGLFSVGNIASAGIISALLWAGLTPLQAILCMVSLCAALLAYYGRHMLPFAEFEGAPARAKPTGLVLLLGVLCFIGFLVEGSMLDWSALYLNSEKQMPASIAGIGYAAFSTTMAVGRLTGDAVVSRLGARRVVVAGSLIAMMGMSLAVLGSHWAQSVAGFVLVGVGISNLVPIYCSRAGQQQGMPVAQALAIINSIGYLGILMGPAAIGFVAHLSTLGTALLINASLVLVVLVTSGVTGSAKNAG